jgi:hypothetical protein
MKLARELLKGDEPTTAHLETKTHNNQPTYSINMAHIKNLTLGAGIALAGILLPASVFAGTESKAVVETTTKSIITGDLGVNFVSEYISRGVIQEKQGVIAQPYADLFFSVYEGTGVIDKVTLNLGVWGSFHSNHPFAKQGSDVSSWYEADYIPGVSVTFLKNWTATVSYAEFFSPSAAWDASRNITVNLAYNDADLLGAFALHPHVAYLRELQGSAPYGGEYNGQSICGHGNYYEIGIAPALPACGPVTVSFPINAGFGSNDFYLDNKGFGYFSGGVNASVALGFIPSSLGSWSANAGVTYMRLNDTNADFAGTGADRFIWQGGIGATF